MAPVWEAKWNILTNEIIEPRDWAKLYKYINKSKLSANLQYFQYQIVSRTLVTNKKLKQFKIVEDENRSFCETEMETIENTLFSCPNIRALWLNII